SGKGSPATPVISRGPTGSPYTGMLLRYTTLPELAVLSDLPYDVLVAAVDGGLFELLRVEGGEDLVSIGDLPDSIVERMRDQQALRGELFDDDDDLLVESESEGADEGPADGFGPTDQDEEDEEEDETGRDAG